MIPKDKIVETAGLVSARALDLCHPAIDEARKTFGEERIAVMLIVVVETNDGHGSACHTYGMPENIIKRTLIDAVRETFPTMVVDVQMPIPKGVGQA